jgi:diacylglycerol kinase (ATP)
VLQAEAVKLELNGKARKKAYLQMDGEPWMQPMGTPEDEPTVVLIEKLPQPSLLLKR